MFIYRHIRMHKILLHLLSGIIAAASVLFSMTVYASEKEDDALIRDALKTMTLEEKIAQLFFITPEALTGVDQVTAAGEMTQMAYDRCPVGGLVYFEPNIVGESQWKELSSNMIRYSMERTGFPVLIAVDEEGGSVTRFSGRGISESIPYITDMYSVGSSGNPGQAYETGYIIGSYLSDFNVNVDFAPVADVFLNPANTVIGNRAFSSDPETAAVMVENTVKGMHDAGILCTLKHFPGHGNTTGDSHSGKVYNSCTLEELEQCELLPFIAGIREGADFIMVGHISLPNITGSDAPATFSYTIITQLLREQLGYEGVIITDAMNMGAVSAEYSSAEAALTCFLAGVDMMLMPVDFDSAYQAVLEAVTNGLIPEEQIDASVERILRAKNRILKNMYGESVEPDSESLEFGTESLEPEPEPPASVNRTYEKVDPSPAVVANFYDLSLKLDTENDRLTEKVSMDIQNNTDSVVDTVYLRYNPMGYFDYLCEANPEAADANKDKKAQITGIKFAGGEKELTAEYLLDDTSVKISLADDAMKPGEKRTLIVDAWTDIPEVEDRFGMLRRDEGKLYALALCFPYVDCSSDGMWQIDPPLYLGGGGENRNPDFKNYHVEIEVPEQFEVACAGVPVKKDGTVSVDLENIRDFAVLVSDFMDVDTFETRGVAIRNYYLRTGDMEAYREISKQTIIDSFDFYTDLLGDYQRREYSMAQYIDGMEYSGFAVVDGRNLMDDGPDDGNKLMRNTAHEVGHSWFYDAVGNNEYNEGWIDEGIVSYLASKELVLKEIEAYKTEKKHGSDWTVKDQIKAVKESDDLIEKHQLKDLDHCYLNTPWHECPENSDPGDKEYIYAPIFLCHAKEIMGEEAFNSFLREVYQTYAMKIVHSGEILEILQKYDNSSKMNELTAFYFDNSNGGA